MNGNQLIVTKSILIKILKLQADSIPGILGIEINEENIDLEKSKPKIKITAIVDNKYSNIISLIKELQKSLYLKVSSLFDTACPVIDIKIVLKESKHHE